MMTALTYVAMAFVIGMSLTTTGCASGYTAASDLSGQVTVQVKETSVGKITLGTGWNTWDHWARQELPRFRLTWNDDQWAAYLGLLKDSGADWIRLDFYYGNTEPRNDNEDPEIVNWAAFTFDSPALRSLYKLLDFCQVNGINVYLTYTYLRSNHEYNADKLTGWLSKEAVSKGFPELWTRPKDEPVDTRELAENLAATTYHLLKNRHYTCIKQVALYVEPDTQWTNVDGFRDTVFLGELLTRLGIRDQVAILAPHTSSYYSPSLFQKRSVGKVLDRHDRREQETGPLPFTARSFPAPEADFDVYAIEDYSALVDWTQPEQGLKNLNPGFKSVVSEVKKLNPSMEVGLMEYGNMWNEGATDPLPSYLSTLSAACFVFELYNSGFAGTQRWSFDPVSHPYLGFAVVKVEGVQFPPAATEVIPETTIPIITAMERGAKLVKVPQTFEPQRLINTNLQRRSTVYQVEVSDPTPPGKGVCAVASTNEGGKWRLGLVNLYPTAREVKVTIPSNALPGQLQWDYYDTTLPQSALRGIPPQLNNNTLSLRLPARSLNFLVEQALQ